MSTTIDFVACSNCGKAFHGLTPCCWLSQSEIADIRELNDYLDDPPISNSFLRDVLPGVKILLDIAWFITEETIRNSTGKCSSTATRKDEHEPESGPAFTCQCCRYFKSLDTHKTRAIRSRL